MEDALTITSDAALTDSQSAKIGKEHLAHSLNTFFGATTRIEADYSPSEDFRRDLELVVDDVPRSSANVLFTPKSHSV